MEASKAGAFIRKESRPSGRLSLLSMGMSCCRAVCRAVGCFHPTALVFKCQVETPDTTTSESTFLWQQHFAAQAVFASLGVNLDELHPHFVANGKYTFHRLKAFP